MGVAVQIFHKNYNAGITNPDNWPSHPVWNSVEAGETVCRVGESSGGK